jgi:hypothetical protein
MLIIANVVTHFGDWLISSYKASVLTVRKMCNSIGKYTQAWRDENELFTTLFSKLAHFIKMMQKTCEQFK